jgi:hypothetical protein
MRRRNSMKKVDIIKAVAVANKACGGGIIANEVMEIYVKKLEPYHSQAVLNALDLCVEEIKGVIAIRDIIQRIKIEDGRPGPEEAWSMVPKSDNETVVWSEEMSSAWGIARSLLPDKVAARMAFIESYRSHVHMARKEHRKVKWSPSIGEDPNQRDRVIAQAVIKGRLSAKFAKKICPELPPMAENKQLQSAETKRLDGIVKGVGE